MEHAFYGPLGSLTVPPKQRHFATTDHLPTYAAQINELRKQGGKLVTVYPPSLAVQAPAYTKGW